jgi:type I restriction enzyme M protein
MLEQDLIEAIIALPTDLFYNTGIGIYVFILSKNKRKERKGKVQLINAVNYWKPLSKSLGKKRREISREDTKAILELYANFRENTNCKIFETDEFMYKEYSVYQPLQRNYAITKERIEKMTADGVISSVYNSDKAEELELKDPRTAAEEILLKGIKAAKPLYDAILNTLEKAAGKKVYKKKTEFMAVFEPLFEGLPKQYQNMKEAKKNDLIEKIAFGLSEIDKTAEIQKDKAGNIIYDSTTKDTELVKLTENVDAYFKREVYPHIPDAHYVYEYGEEGKLPLYPSKQSAASLGKEKIGAEFPFTRYFYEYKEPEKSDKLLERFMELEKSIATKIKELGK